MIQSFFHCPGAFPELIQFLKFIAYIGNVHIMHKKKLSNTHSSVFKVK